MQHPPTAPDGPPLSAQGGLSATTASPTPTGFSADAYYATQPAPENLDATVTGVQAFVERHVQEGRRIVLVTSGGTTVPLELNVVRFLDNFSAGTRGATSAEYFLEQDYAVIFMHRQFSLQPFLRHYSHATNPFLDFLDIEEDDRPLPAEADQHGGSTAEEGPASGTTTGHHPGTRRRGGPRVVVNPSPTGLPRLLETVRRHKAVQTAGTLYTLTFVTVDDYLFLLRALAPVMRLAGRRAMYYLAAAVSDFFLPRQKMSQHKIQSGKGSLHIEMDQVPKILKPLVSEWTPEGYIISFKLETDPEILIPKARAALERYGHQVVIGNELHSRKYQVAFVERRVGAAAEGEGSDGSPYREEWIRIREGDEEIEKVMIELLVQRHDRWIAAGET